VSASLRPLAWGAALCLATAAGANGQTVSVAPDGRFELRAQAEPIGRVLRDLARVAPIRLLIDPAVEARTVTPAAASGLRADQALEAVLSASGLPHLVWGGTKGPWRVVLGDEASAVEVRAAAPAAEPSASAPDSAGTVAGPADVAAAAVRKEERIAEAEAQREAEAQPVAVNDAPGVPGGYTQTMENVTYNDPSFVPYKNRPEVKARRLKTDVTQIP
jgi:hypothetical protein